MRQSLIDHLRDKTNLGQHQGFTIPMPEEVVDALVEWLRMQQQDYDGVAFMGSPGDIADLLSEET